VEAPEFGARGAGTATQTVTRDASGGVYTRDRQRLVATKRCTNAIVRKKPTAGGLRSSAGLRFRTLESLNDDSSRSKV
jgi:hypothetical protein